jgi:hypothetical protein
MALNWISSPKVRLLARRAEIRVNERSVGA